MLASETPLSTGLTTWFCLDPVDANSETTFSCGRLLPSESASTTTDFRYVPGPLTVVTYLDSRVTSQTNGLFAQVGAVTGSIESHDITIAGAVSGLAASAVAIAAALAF